jgi:hypothetical protein
MLKRGLGRMGVKSDPLIRRSGPAGKTDVQRRGKGAQIRD